MAAIAADRHLLFGLLALQNGLINQAQLVAAFQAWTLDKARDLAAHLIGLGHLNDAHGDSWTCVMPSSTPTPVACCTGTSSRAT